jgi:hypothetical protein
VGFSLILSDFSGFILYLFSLCFGIFVQWGSVERHISLYNFDVSCACVLHDYITLGLSLSNRPLLLFTLTNVLCAYGPTYSQQYRGIFHQPGRCYPGPPSIEADYHPPVVHPRRMTAENLSVSRGITMSDGHYIHINYLDSRRRRIC